MQGMRDARGCAVTQAGCHSPSINSNASKSNMSCTLLILHNPGDGST